METLAAHLNALAHTIKALLQSQPAEVPTEPGHEPVMGWEAEKFEYSTEGIDTGRLSGYSSFRPVWIRTFIAVQKKLEGTTDHQKALDLLVPYTSTFFNAGNSLQRLLNRITHAYLDLDQTDPDQWAADNIDRFLHQLQTHTIHAQAKAFLLGLILESESVALTPEVTLRRPRVEEIVSATPAFEISPIDILPFPTAVLDISRDIKTEEQAVFTEDIGQYVSVLQLFSVGGIYRKFLQVTTDAIISGAPPRATFGGAQAVALAPKFVIAQALEPKLITFFNYMQLHAPRFTGIDKPVNPLTVAFDRYLDACTDARIFERQVMNAIMGLEALFLDEHAELAYKLAMRCAKAMSFLGIDPLIVTKTIKTGYTIRSTFAHGSNLSSGKRSSLTNDFGSLHTIATRLANYLRISICAYIILSLEKTSFINSLDKALVTGGSGSKISIDLASLQQFLIL
jgi:Apea-like HEPN